MAFRINSLKAGQWSSTTRKRDGGEIDDWWDRPVTDLGLPGSDKGYAKFLPCWPRTKCLSPRAIESCVPGPLSLVCVPDSDPDPEKAKALLAGVRIYPYRDRGNPPVNRVLKPAGRRTVDRGTASSLPTGNGSQALSPELGEDRDRFFMAMLKPLGIEKGKPFDDGRRLVEAALVGEAMPRSARSTSGLEAYAIGRALGLCSHALVDQDVDSSTQFEERTALFLAIGMSVGSIPKTPGHRPGLPAHTGDNGDNTYRLHVPPNAPVNQFWSITL